MSVVGRKLNFKKDDIVEVISGREQGKKGKVLRCFPMKAG